MNRYSLIVNRSRVLVALLLCATLAGCGMINWSISNSGDGCPPASKSTIPCS